MINLVVKGCKDTALRAAEDAAVPVTFVRELSEWPETVLQAQDRYRTAIGRWFNQAPFEAPYPEGTLLIYSDAN